MSNSVMWLSQQVLETISQNIGTIIACSKKQKDSNVIPSVLLVIIIICTNYSGVCASVMIITWLPLHL